MDDISNDTEYGWEEWRCKFLTAGFIVDVLAGKPGAFYQGFRNKRNQYFDDCGVLQLPWVEREVPNLENPVAWGEESSPEEDDTLSEDEDLSEDTMAGQSPGNDL